jgi:methyl-accepting chemotaxis protein
VKIICKVEIACGLVSAVLSAGAGVVKGEGYYVFLTAFILLTMVCSYLAIRLCNKGLLRQASWLMLVSVLVALVFVTMTEDVTTLPIVAMGLFPVVLSVIMLSRVESFFISLAYLLFLIGVYLSQVTFKLYQPPVTQPDPTAVASSWLSATVTMVACIYGLLQNSFVSQGRALQEQYRRLQDSYQELDRRQRLSEELSREISALTTQLETLTVEQASRTAQQVTSVSQVTAGLEELNETASQIAFSSSASTQSSQQTLAVVEQVKQASQLSYRAAQQGNQAVEKANTSVKEVHSRVDLLGERLAHLTEQTRQVGSIVDIIEDIAAETHLLALNASIEAAGASSYDDGWLAAEKMGKAEPAEAAAMPRWVMVQGERFGIIAQEIRNLAERSRKAAKEVQGFIGEMQSAAGAATIVAEESKKEAASALVVSEQVTGAISELTEVIAQNVTSVEHIFEAAHSVSQSCEEISSATNQQRAANFQILQTMREISNVAQRSASELGGLVLAAGRLTGRVGELNQVLDQ